MPQSEADYYYEGEFVGTLDEVIDNLQAFGRLEVVAMNRGFFSDALPDFGQAFSSIWMDVGLESSSKDRMDAPARLTRSCLRIQP